MACQHLEGLPAGVYTLKRPLPPHPEVVINTLPPHDVATLDLAITPVAAAAARLHKGKGQKHPHLKNRSCLEPRKAKPQKTPRNPHTHTQLSQMPLTEFSQEHLTLRHQSQQHGGMSPATTTRLGSSTCWWPSQSTNAPWKPPSPSPRANCSHLPPKCAQRLQMRP